MKKILAIDLGTHTGWSMGQHLSGVEDFSVKRQEGKSMRFVRFKNWLAEMLKGADSDGWLVVFEETSFFRGADASLVYGGLLAQLQIVCDEHDIPYKGVLISEIKKHATGKGNANKEAMVARAQVLWPEQFTSGDDNEADARHLHALASERWGK